jgi:hypothetical protein
MTVGPGKYDDLCTHVREEAQAVGSVVVVIQGKYGSGFSVQIPETRDHQRALVNSLRLVADQIEEDLGPQWVS